MILGFFPRFNAPGLTIFHAMKTQSAMKSESSITRLRRQRFPLDGGALECDAWVGNSEENLLVDEFELIE